jgi:hypothetical protein
MKHAQQNLLFLLYQIQKEIWKWASLLWKISLSVILVLHSQIKVICGVIMKLLCLPVFKGFSDLWGTTINNILVFLVGCVINPRVTNMTDYQKYLQSYLYSESIWVLAIKRKMKFQHHMNLWQVSGKHFKTIQIFIRPQHLPFSFANFPTHFPSVHFKHSGYLFSKCLLKLISIVWKKNDVYVDMVVHFCNLSTWEADTGGTQV